MIMSRLKTSLEALTQTHFKTHIRRSEEILCLSFDRTKYNVNNYFVNVMVDVALSPHNQTMNFSSYRLKLN